MHIVLPMNHTGNNVAAPANDRSRHLVARTLDAENDGRRFRSCHARLPGPSLQNPQPNAPPTKPHRVKTRQRANQPTENESARGQGSVVDGSETRVAKEVS